jgi:hypothetical protein
LFLRWLDYYAGREGVAEEYEGESQIGNLKFQGQQKGRLESKSEGMRHLAEKLINEDSPGKPTESSPVSKRRRTTRPFSSRPDSAMDCCWRSSHPAATAWTRLPLEIVAADLELTRSAAELRAEHKLPYIDCFAASLAVSRKASLATSDKDFGQVEKRLEILRTLGG